MKSFSGGKSSFRVANWDLLQFLTATENWESSQTFVNCDWKLGIATENSRSSPTRFSSTAIENSGSPTRQLQLKARNLLQLTFQLQLVTENFWTRTHFQVCETRCSRILRHGYHSYDIIGCHAEYTVCNIWNTTCTYTYIPIIRPRPCWRFTLRRGYWSGRK